MSCPSQTGRTVVIKDETGEIPCKDACLVSKSGSELWATPTFFSGLQWRLQVPDLILGLYNFGHINIWIISLAYIIGSVARNFGYEQL